MGGVECAGIYRAGGIRQQGGLLFFWAVQATELRHQELAVGKGHAEIKGTQHENSDSFLAGHDGFCLSLFIFPYTFLYAKFIGWLREKLY